MATTCGQKPEQLTGDATGERAGGGTSVQWGTEGTHWVTLWYTTSWPCEGPDAVPVHSIRPVHANYLIGKKNSRFKK